jgi:hypothetical protein
MKSKVKCACLRAASKIWAEKIIMTTLEAVEICIKVIVKACISANNLASKLASYRQISSALKFEMRSMGAEMAKSYSTGRLLLISSSM